MFQQTFYWINYNVLILYSGLSNLSWYLNCFVSNVYYSNSLNCSNSYNRLYFPGLIHISVIFVLNTSLLVYCLTAIIQTLQQLYFTGYKLAWTSTQKRQESFQRYQFFQSLNFLYPSETNYYLSCTLIHFYSLVPGCGN